MSIVRIVTNVLPRGIPAVYDDNDTSTCKSNALRSPMVLTTCCKERPLAPHEVVCMETTCESLPGMVCLVRGPPRRGSWLLPQPPTLAASVGVSGMLLSVPFCISRNDVMKMSGSAKDRLHLERFELSETILSADREDSSNPDADSLCSSPTMFIEHWSRDQNATFYFNCDNSPVSDDRALKYSDSGNLIPLKCREQMKYIPSTASEDSYVPNAGSQSPIVTRDVVHGSNDYSVPHHVYPVLDEEEIPLEPIFPSSSFGALGANESGFDSRYDMSNNSSHSSSPFDTVFSCQEPFKTLWTVPSAGASGSLNPSTSKIIQQISIDDLESSGYGDQSFLKINTTESSGELLNTGMVRRSISRKCRASRVQTRETTLIGHRRSVSDEFESVSFSSLSSDRKQPGESFEDSCDVVSETNPLKPSLSVSESNPDLSTPKSSRLIHGKSQNGLEGSNHGAQCFLDADSVLKCHRYIDVTPAGSCEGVLNTGLVKRGTSRKNKRSSRVLVGGKASTRQHRLDNDEAFESISLSPYSSNQKQTDELFGDSSDFVSETNLLKPSLSVSESNPDLSTPKSSRLIQGKSQNEFEGSNHGAQCFLDADSVLESHKYMDVTPAGSSEGLLNTGLVKRGTSRKNKRSSRVLVGRKSSTGRQNRSVNDEAFESISLSPYSSNQKRPDEPFGGSSEMTPRMPSVLKSNCSSTPSSTELMSTKPDDGKRNFPDHFAQSFLDTDFVLECHEHMGTTAGRSRAIFLNTGLVRRGSSRKSTRPSRVRGRGKASTRQQSVGRDGGISKRSRETSGDESNFESETMFLKSNECVLESKSLNPAISTDTMSRFTIHTVQSFTEEDFTFLQNSTLNPRSFRRSKMRRVSRKRNLGTTTSFTTSLIGGS